MNFIPKTCSFHGLPKIHKSSENAAIQTHKSECINILNASELTFWAIIVGSSCSKSRLSNLIDIILQFTKQIKSYLSPYQMATFDNRSWYSKIAHELSTETISFYIDKQSDILYLRFTKEFHMNSIDLILNEQYFLNLETKTISKP